MSVEFDAQFLNCCISCTRINLAERTERQVETLTSTEKTEMQKYRPESYEDMESGLQQKKTEMQKYRPESYEDMESG